jgi:hypothetical protein
LASIIDKDLELLVTEKSEEVSNMCESLGKRMERRGSDVLNRSIHPPQISQNSNEKHRDKNIYDELACGEEVSIP